MDDRLQKMKAIVAVHEISLIEKEKLRICSIELPDDERSPSLRSG
jgi:hypothetical protein